MIFSRLLPKSLLWRSVMIVVAPMVLLQLVVAYLIIERHFDGVTRQMTDTVGSELRYVVEQVETADSAIEARGQIARAARTLGFAIALIDETTLPRTRDPKFYDVIGNAVEDTLRDRLGRPIAVAIDLEEKFVEVRVATRWGVLKADAPKRRLVAANPHLLITWMAAAAAGLIAIALIYLRNQVRPIQELATAAEAFGKGRSVPLRVAGAQEVRLAASAFLDARTRIERHIEQRTRMLSGVSHDLRTPLTRMKLALAMVEDGPEIDELRHDVRDMEHILEEFLAYARGDQGESFEPTDVLELARTVVQETRRRGGAIALHQTVETPGETALALRPQAIKRCLHNLIENALTYGSRARLGVTVTRAQVEFAIEDDGPGIPPERREQAFRPFQRLDESRNRNGSGGVGLGLALALDTVRGHGGDLRLEASAAMGGLRAVARLPR